VQVKSSQFFLQFVISGLGGSSVRWWRFSQRWKSPFK